MMRRSSVWFAAFALSACSSGLVVDQIEFCRRQPSDPSCGVPAGSAGVAGAAGGPAGAAGIAGAGEGGTAGIAGLAGAGSGGNGGAGGPSCTAPELDCDGACVDIKASDAENCGACGRSCRGSTCEAGACVPEAMTSGGEVAPYALADDGTSLYWVSPAVKAGAFDPRVRRAPKAAPGGVGEAVFAGADVRARSLVFAGGKLYWGELGAAGQAVLSGTPGGAFPDSPPFAADQLDVRHVAVVGSKAFWAVGGEGAVRGKPLAGGPVSPELFGQPNPGWLAADEAGALYWVAGVTREVRRGKAGAPGFETFATGADVVSVELAGERVYWTDAAAGTVRSALKTATLPAEGVVEFAGHGRVEGFRVEGTTLYVLALEAGELRAWRKGEGDEEPLMLGKVAAKAVGYAGNPFGAAHVLADATHVYFADPGTVDVGQVVPESQGDGAVYRLAR
jgi:hypothetical protein